MTRITKIAAKIACQSPCEHYRHGAIVLLKGRFITGAFNMPMKTDPHGGGVYSSAHAEIRAIRKARAILNRNDLSDCTIFVLRLNKRGDIKFSKPCKDCQIFIDKHGLEAQWSTGVEDVI